MQFGVESVKRPDITGSLDFTALAAAAAAPAVPPAPPAAPAPAAVPAPVSKPAPARKVEDTAASRLHPAIREAAVLHAKGQSAPAKARLAKALEGELPAAAQERGWLMLLEAHQVLDERAPFEARSIAFAERFLRSAPTWRAPAAPASPSPAHAGGAAVSLTGKLSAESAAQMQKLRELALKNGALRLDVSKLQGADGPGCRMLVELLQALRRADVELALDGESVLLGALGRATRAGAKDVDPALWKLRLELLQRQGRQDEFDAVAVDYAVTYEESPPSFEPQQKAGASPASATQAPASHGEEIELPGEMTGSADELLQRIELAAALQEGVTLLCARTTRIDLAAAGALRSLVERLHATGKQVMFRHPTALVSALLETAGVSAHATVVERS